MSSRHRVIGSRVCGCGCGLVFVVTSHNPEQQFCNRQHADKSRVLRLTDARRNAVPRQRAQRFRNLINASLSVNGMVTRETIVALCAKVYESGYWAGHKAGHKSGYKAGYKAQRSAA